MEGGIPGRWKKKALVGTILLLMLQSMFVHTFTMLPPEEKMCPHGDYRTEEGICCNKCSPGLKLVEKCHAQGSRSNCTPCATGEYTDQMNFSTKCRRCRRCRTNKHEIEVSPCERHQNTICRCEDGYYKFSIDSETFECRKCTKCGTDEKEKHTCTSEKNTVCECTENYYRVNRKCEPCKNCTAECKHHCSSPPTLNTKAPGSGQSYLINVIGGVGAVALVLIVLVTVITYMITKWLTKKKLLKLSSNSSDISPDACKQILISTEETCNDISIKAVPQSPVSEQEQPSAVCILPDCVPLEIKIPDLIYTVLDLVPVLQVKQLVRSLGVKEKEIELAELDHRPHQEAHYQMLRVWAEGQSRAGGMLHRSLLQELLDVLRNMHLGQAAEELETKYGM